jgi:hypothetical protein
LRTRLGRGEIGNAPGKGGISNHLVFPSVNAKRQVSAKLREEGEDKSGSHGCETDW